MMRKEESIINVFRMKRNKMEDFSIVFLYPVVQSVKLTLRVIFVSEDFRFKHNSQCSQ